MAQHNEYGEWGESVAIDHLRENNYVILDTNWRSASGREIDIIARKDTILVFVEVKTRTNEDMMRAADAVTPQKINHIVSAANSYLRLHALNIPIRFDIITVVGHEPDYQVTHIEDAFLPPQRIV